MSFLTLLSGLLTPVIGAIALYIAYQQYKVNKYKVKIDLFDRRLAIYVSAMDFIADIFKTGAVKVSDCLNLKRNTRTAIFLFPSSVHSYIDLLYKEGIELTGIQDQLKGNVTEECRKDAAAKNTELLKWFTEQLNAATETFKKYLYFGIR